MKAAVVTFPGSNCDRDLMVAFEAAGFEVANVWHKDSALPEGTDIVGVPGGFSYGDYLRCGAIAAQSPICAAVKTHAERGGMAIGICNGFQVLCELGLLPGVLMRNAGVTFVCKPCPLVVASDNSPFLDGYARGQEITIPIAHHDGNYFADAETLLQLEAEERVAFRYRDNPNGSQGDIAGVLSENRRVLGMMPHPERAWEPTQGNTDGAAMFKSLAEALVPA